MRKALLLLALAALMPKSMHADEGMWTLYNLPGAVYQQMEQYGFQMSPAQLYGNSSSLSQAVVNFGGFCTGVVVSADGLVFTNHHCGFDAIRRHSTVKHDYMLNGFVAQSFAEELPNEDLFVSFMVSQEDVTERLNKLGMASLPYADIEDFVDSVENAWQKEMRAKDSTLRVEVKPFYEGNKYYMTTYRDFNDVRLVFTIPKSMGKFGGDTDNWMWPRQTCDFSVFRIYANPKTNGPAKYSKENVPYHPAAWARVSLGGYKPGDFAMVMGYPGSTDRYLSSYGIQERRDAVNATMVQARGIKQEIMLRHMNLSDAIRIMYESKYAHSSNYWKNSIGMNKCIDSIGLIAQKRTYEQLISRWQDSTGFMKDKLDFSLLDRLYSHRFDAVRALQYWSETWGGESDELTVRAKKISRGMEILGPKDREDKQYVRFDDNRKEWDSATDRELLAAMMENYRKQVPRRYHPEFFQLVDSLYGGSMKRYVDHLYKHSLLMKSGKKLFVNSKKYTNDPGVFYGQSIMALLSDIYYDYYRRTTRIEEQEKMLCAARLRMEQDMPNYSDANFTLRLTYGQVGEYSLGGKPSGYYTTARSMWEKMQQGATLTDYYAEPEMHRLLSASDYGRYADPQTGTMQLCFLTNNDITGGNSGSPVFNGRGELIGLAFDGNWDSLSSDIFFDKTLARTISVDIRYVLYMMDRWGHADRLLKEISPVAAQ